MQTGYFSRFITEGGEKKGRRTCKSVLDALLTPEAQCKYFTWSGRKTPQAQDKQAFKTVAAHIVDFVYSIVHKVQPDYSVSAFYSRMNEILKAAKSRTTEGKETNKANRTKSLECAEKKIETNANGEENGNVLQNVLADDNKSETIGSESQNINPISTDNFTFSNSVAIMPTNDSVLTLPAVEKILDLSQY